MDLAATIVAVSSPPGRSRRAIIRCTGPDAHHVAQLLLNASPSGTGIANISLGDQTLPVVASLFPSGRSFTGQDTLELHLPGHPALVDRVLKQMLEVGEAARVDIRHAHPGEFSGRAYLTGRLSLIEAEGIALRVAASSDAHLTAANALMDGSLGDWVRAAADEVATLLALVEAGTDFADEEDVVAIDSGSLQDRIRSVVTRIDEHLEHATGTEVLDGIPRVVLSGPPNAGKSTLFNALLARDRVLVSDLAGTTRDVIEEPLAVPCGSHTAEVLLQDVAGIDDGDGALAGAMRRQAEQAIDQADLVIHCVGPGDPLPTVEGGVVVLTKSDLANGTPPPPHAVALCARSGQGVEELRAIIGDRLLGRAVSLSSDVVVMTARHASALRAAQKHLAETMTMLMDGSRQRLSDPEIIAELLRTALHALGEIVGVMTPDDVLERVFSSFCIGK